MRFIDLFAGIGGLRLGFEKAGGECVFSSEIDKYAKITYELNFREKPAGDIKQIKSKDIPKHDILAAGFPCQPFSVAGEKKGLKDVRGNLFYEIIRILEDCQPQAFLLENVKGLTSLNKGKTFKLIHEELEGRGYKVYSKVLNTMDYGDIPQTRERVYIAGFLNDYKFSFPEKMILRKTVKDIILKEKQDEKYYYDRFEIFKVLQQYITKKDTVYQWRRSYVRENKSKVCPALMAHMGTGGHNVPLIKDEHGIRKLTPIECAKFQGFPDDFKLPDNMSDSHLYKQFGNSVSIPVVKRIAEKIIEGIQPVGMNFRRYNKKLYSEIRA